MSKIAICIDVPEMTRGLEFYTQALGFKLVSQGEEYSELSVDGIKVYIVEKASGSNPLTIGKVARNYDRHWTPVHFDIAVEDVEESASRIVEFGGLKEGGKSGDWGSIAFCSDPFGSGFCITKYNG